MLEPIVEYHAVQRESIENPATKLVSIRPDRHDGFGTMLRDQVWFVPGFLKICKDPCTVRHYQHRLAARSPIAAAEHRDSLAFGEQPSGYIDDKRRFPCSSDGEIADADDGDGKSLLPKPSPFIAVGAKPGR